MQNVRIMVRPRPSADKHHLLSILIRRDVLAILGILVGLAYAASQVHEFSHVIVCEILGGEWQIHYGLLLDPTFAECNH
jgi:hypothetical protein